jgi:prephenate dehydratase
MKKQIAIQGFKGSYSDEAVKKVFKKNAQQCDLIENSTFKDAFDSIRKYGLGLIPTENSTAGFVEEVIDELSTGEFEIVGEYSLPIHHHLVGVPGSKLDDVKQVYSHYQALAQTRDFLENNKIEIMDFGDTAGGAKYVSESGDKTKAGIGSKVLAEIYNLKILARKINNEDGNETRFFLIRKKKGKKTDCYFKRKQAVKNAVIFKTKDIPGSLYKTLGGFATNNVNLTRIISRPVPGEKFAYMFFIEFDGA